MPERIADRTNSTWRDGSIHPRSASHPRSPTVSPRSASHPRSLKNMHFPPHIIQNMQHAIQPRFLIATHPAIHWIVVPSRPDHTNVEQRGGVPSLTVSHGTSHLRSPTVTHGQPRSATVSQSPTVTHDSRRPVFRRVQLMQLHPLWVSLHPLALRFAPCVCMYLW